MFIGSLGRQAPGGSFVFLIGKGNMSRHLKSRVMRWPLPRIMEGEALRRQARPLSEQRLAELAPPLESAHCHGGSTSPENASPVEDSPWRARTDGRTIAEGTNAYQAAEPSRSCRTNVLRTTRSTCSSLSVIVGRPPRRTPLLTGADAALGVPLVSDSAWAWE
jgi:hypothetical protein